MIKPVQCQRLLGLTLLLLVSFGYLGYRLVDLQVMRYEELSEKVQRRRGVELLETRRGEIRDIRGNLLATSTMVKTVCADPARIAPYRKEVARALAPLLSLDYDTLYRKLEPKVWVTENGGLATNRYLVLERKVREERWEKIRQTMLHLPLDVDEQERKKNIWYYRGLRRIAIFEDKIEDQLREYPNEELAAHVIGFVGRAQAETVAGKVDTIAGRSGIEAKLDSQLRGVFGWRQIEEDARAKEIVEFRQQEVAPRPGLNVILSLDLGVQAIVEEELAAGARHANAKSGTAIVMRPRTGEILALANYPSYDPNRPGGAKAEERRNRAITDIMEPGSTFKIVVASGALNEGIVGLDETFDCEQGAWRFGGRILHDHHPYELLTVQEIIQKSSNIGAAKIGVRLGANRLYDYMRGFGFGEPTGVPLPGEVNGTVHPVSRWNKLSISRIPMGHEVAVTPLQMVMAMGAIANGGVLMRPMLVDRLEDAEGRVVAKYEPQPARQVIGSPAARQMVAALKSVVSREGTASQAMLDRYSVAGKTGTAQKPIPGGYSHTKYYASFIGFMPAEAAKICVFVGYDEPMNGHYGGTIAAPVFRTIAERLASYLNIRAGSPGGTPVPEVLVVQDQNRAFYREDQR